MQRGREKLIVGGVALIGVIVLVLALFGGGSDEPRRERKAQRKAQEASGELRIDGLSDASQADTDTDTDTDTETETGTAEDTGTGPELPSGPEGTVQASEQDREVLVGSLRKFATRKSYSFNLTYKLTQQGAELMNLNSSGQVQDHKFTHAITNCAGVQAEVASNGSMVYTRQAGAAEWEEVDSGMDMDESMGGGDPAAFLELMNSAVMKNVPVEKEGNATVEGREAVVLAMPWSQELTEADDPDPLSSEGRIKFYVDPKTQDIIKWEMNSAIRQGDPTQDIEMQIGCNVSGYDQPMNAALPQHLKEALMME